MSTTWKQVVLDTADAVREANGSTAKIPVGQLADKVRAGAGIPYEGENPLTIGQDGYNFPAKTLLKDGLQIVNGVNGEDLTDTAADQTTAAAELMKMVGRKLADHKGEGDYVWKKLTAEGGEFLDYVVSNDTEAYPNGGMQDGFWYELVKEGVPYTGANPLTIGEDGATIPANTLLEEALQILNGVQSSPFLIEEQTLTVSSATYTNWITINHSLGVIPKYVIAISNTAKPTGASPNDGVPLYSIFIQNVTTGARDVHTICTDNNYNYYSGQGNGSKLTASTVQFGSISKHYSSATGSTSNRPAQFVPGVTYKIILMA